MSLINKNTPFSETCFKEENGFGKFKPDAIELLKKTINILKEFKIKYFIISGTLLGYVRHKDIIPWDDDIDIMVDNTIILKFNQMYQKYKNELTFINNQNFLFKICNKNKCKPIQSYFYKNCLLNKNDQYFWPFIDIFVYNQSGNKLDFYNKSWDKKEFFPLKKVNFLNMKVNIPSNPDYFLKINYGPNYLKTFVSNNWNHKCEKSHTKIEKVILD